MPQISVSKGLFKKLNRIREITGQSPSRYIEAMIDRQIKRGPYDTARRWAYKFSLMCGKPFPEEDKEDCAKIFASFITQDYMTAMVLLEQLNRKILDQLKRRRK